MRNAAALPSGEVPFLARVAGLPASAVSPFASPRCQEKVCELLRLEAEIETARAHLVDRLFLAIHDARPELRRFLLDIKRDCFNSRNLSGRLDAPLWPEAEALTAPLARDLCVLEEQLTACWTELAAIWDGEHRRQRQALLETLASGSVLRGLALAGPALVEGMPRLRDSPLETESRKERKLEASLLRYVCRAALKLSPNSTLTRLALGITDGVAPGGMRLLGRGPEDWTERSLLRLRRIHLDQWWEMVVACPGAQPSLAVTLNETLEETEAGPFRWLRRGRWRFDSEHSQLRYHAEAWVKASLSQNLVRACREALGEGPLPLVHLAGRLLSQGEVRNNVELDRLLDLGLLRFQAPWASDESCVEKRLLEFLRSLPDEAGLGALLEPLAHLVHLEASFATAISPAQALTEIAQAEAQVQETAAALAGWRLTSGSGGSYRRGRLYEDVFLHCTTGSGVRELVRASHGDLAATLASSTPLVRLAFLYNRRHDFLQALAEHMVRHYPRQERVGFLDLLHTAQPLWKEYSRFLTASESKGGWCTTFNPFNLPNVEELDRLRQDLGGRLGACVEEEDGEERLSAHRLEALLAPIPERFAPLLGAALLLQPIDGAGRRWYLNRMYEGTGRYGSRFTAAMDETTRSSLTDHLIARSRVKVEGESIELLDLMCVQGDTLNVHAVQTWKVLDINGGRLDLPIERQVRLNELKVERAGPQGLPWLTDPAGQRFLPIHLGGANQFFMPETVKFLSLLGPGEMRAVFPPRREQGRGELRFWQRMALGPLVFARKHWSCPLERLAGILAQSDLAAFVALQRWRLQHGLPERLFVLERIAHNVLADRYKPQYLDLTSPLFLPVLRSAIQSSRGTVGFQEALPSPEELPAAEGGRRWAVELLVDDIAFHPEPHEAEELSPAVTLAERV